MANVNSTKKELETELGTEEAGRAEHDAAFEMLKGKYKTEI